MPPERDWSDEAARTEPVDAERCLWCKHRVDGTDYHTLETGERLCAECAGDAREFKRDVFVDLLVAASLRPSVRNAMLDEWADVQALLLEWHRDDPRLNMIPARESHAHGRSEL